MLAQYFGPGRAEWFIALGRAVLAGFSLLAMWRGSLSPGRGAGVASVVLVAYTLYAAWLVLLAWRVGPSASRHPVLTHILDLAVATLLAYQTGGPVSPFFVFFVFSLVTATVRWQWRGTLWTAVGALTAFFGLWFVGGRVFRDPRFEVDDFLIRGAHLAVLAGLLGYLGWRAERWRESAWLREAGSLESTAIGETLASVAVTLDAPRVVLVWEEPEEPWLYVATWSPRSGLGLTREPPGTCQPVVAPCLNDTDFLCADAAAATPTVLRAGRDGDARWTGAPLHPVFRERFAVRAVLGCALRAQSVKGWLFALDWAGMTSKDLDLGGIVAGQVAVHMDQFAARERLQQGAETEARIRLARDLHDGLMQSLTVAGLQTELARGLIATDPGAAAEQLHETQRLLAAEQRDLRALLRDLKPGPDAAPPDLRLTSRLDELCGSIQRQWGVRVTVQTAEGLAPLPRVLERDIYLMVREAVFNSARHGRATAVGVRVGVEERRVRIVVTDDGRGFPFSGRREHVALSAVGGGPVTLWSRVHALGGALTVDSTEAGARLDIALPLDCAGGAIRAAG